MEMVGPYELITKLAVGGMAEVFLARERGLAGLERLVVIKRILPHLADDPSFVDMFQREARIIAQVSHPNVVQIYGLGEEDGRYHIALEYIHGTTVRELQILATKASEALPVGVAIGIATQACRGLHAAHELKGFDGRPLGLVHRDVTPHNLMCTMSGDVKLLDFGVAKATNAGSEETFSGDLKGKFSYMSPEQTLQQHLDRRSDIFAMGIITWEMLTGRRLFKRKSNLEIMQAITNGDVPPPSRYSGGIDQELDDIVARSLAIERGDRFGTSRELLDALRTYASTRDLQVDATTVSTFVSRIAGETLQSRRDKLEQALERPALEQRGEELAGAGAKAREGQRVEALEERAGAQRREQADRARPHLDAYAGDALPGEGVGPAQRPVADGAEVAAAEVERAAPAQVVWRLPCAFVDPAAGEHAQVVGPAAVELLEDVGGGELVALARVGPGLDHGAQRGPHGPGGFALGEAAEVAEGDAGHVECPWSSGA